MLKYFEASHLLVVSTLLVHKKLRYHNLDTQVLTVYLKVPPTKYSWMMKKLSMGFPPFHLPTFWTLQYMSVLSQQSNAVKCTINKTQCKEVDARNMQHPRQCWSMWKYVLLLFFIRKLIHANLSLVTIGKNAIGGRFTAI